MNGPLNGKLKFL